MSARRWLVTAILAVCLGASIAQSFDWWDQAQPTGDDTETALVVVALSVGLAVLVAAVIVQQFASFVRRPLVHRWLTAPCAERPRVLLRLCPDSRPPSPLRV